MKFSASRAAGSGFRLRVPPVPGSGTRHIGRPTTGEGVFSYPMAAQRLRVLMFPRFVPECFEAKRSLGNQGEFARRHGAGFKETAVAQVQSGRHISEVTT